MGIITHAPFFRGGEDYVCESLLGASSFVMNIHNTFMHCVTSKYAFKHSNSIVRHTVTKSGLFNWHVLCVNCGVTGLHSPVVQSSNTVSCVALSLHTHPCVLAIISHSQLIAIDWVGCVGLENERVSEWVIGFSDSGYQDPWSSYRSCNHNLYIDILHPVFCVYVNLW